MKKQNDKPTGLAAVMLDERLTDVDRMQWVDLCMDEHEKGARVRAMYVRRTAGTPGAPSREAYQAAHAEHLTALEAVRAMQARFGGWIAWPTHKSNND